VCVFGEGGREGERERERKGEMEGGRLILRDWLE
jgi:hypothetical protein